MIWPVVLIRVDVEGCDLGFVDFLSHIYSLKTFATSQVFDDVNETLEYSNSKQNLT